jgi:nucleotide-binding universal stress UspA family protein
MKAVNWVKCNLVEPRDTVILVHVRPKFQSFDLDLLESYKELGKSSMEVLQKFAVSFPKNSVEIKFLYGEAREELLEFIQNVYPTLLVVGTRGMSVKKRLLGSTSDYLVVHSKVPVLLCR